VFKAGGGCEGRRYRYNMYMLHASTTIENQLRTVHILFFLPTLSKNEMKNNIIIHAMHSRLLRLL
jgi:hypothetical protein